MPPELVDADAERSADLKATRENIRYFTENMEEFKERYGGRYVIVFEEEVVAAEETSDQAWERAEERGVDASRCVMQYVPEPGRAFFF